MADPVLYEPTIMDTLDCNPFPENTSRLQAAALMCLIDAFDRKLLREHFVSLAEAALQVHTSMGKLYMIDSVQENHRMGILDKDMVNSARTGVQNLSTRSHTELYSLMRKVVACPTSADKVH